MTKPQLCCDVDKDKLAFPVLVSTKIDGVRGLVNEEGRLVARSGKKFKNKLNTKFFSHPDLAGFDGELVCGSPNDLDLCSNTTSAMNTVEGQTECNLHVFDFMIDGVDFKDRLKLLEVKVKLLLFRQPQYEGRVTIVPHATVGTWEEVVDLQGCFLGFGYEGSILRKPDGVYKHGRCTAKEANYMRLKEFGDAEIMVTGVEEGQTNNNELTRGEHGQAERSTHKAGMVGNGQVGSIYGTLLEDFKLSGDKWLEAGTEIKVGAGKVTHNDRRLYWENPHHILGKVVKFQHFGGKEKPRFPTFQCFRMEEDL